MYVSFCGYSRTCSNWRVYPYYNKGNPFRGGTSEFGYPSEGGYDIVSKLLSNYIMSFPGSKILLNETVKRIIVKDGKTVGIEKTNNS